MLRGADFAQSSNFETHDLYLKFVLGGDLTLQTLEGGAVKFFDLAAVKACQVQMVFLRFYFVVVFLTFQVHQVEFVNQAAILEQR